MPWRDWRARAFLFSSLGENIERMRMANKSLCVGINQYKNYPNDGLNGCINDVNEMDAGRGWLGRSWRAWDRHRATRVNRRPGFAKKSGLSSCAFDLALNGDILESEIGRLP